MRGLRRGNSLVLIGGRPEFVGRFRARERLGAPTECSGFTLIELMVVLVLIGILSAMIIPEMKGTYGDALLRSSGRELVNIFSLAYSQAVSLNQVHLVRVERQTGHYVIERRQRGQGKRTEFVPLKDVPGCAGELDNRITIEVHKQNEMASENAEREPGSAAVIESEDQARGDTIAFYPDGTAEAAEILLRDRAGFGLRLKIDPITARVEILERERERE